MVWLADAERGVWKSLHAARSETPATIVGRLGLSAMAVERVQAMASGRSLFLHDKRSVAQVAGSAWGALIDNTQPVKE